MMTARHVTAAGRWFTRCGSSARGIAHRVAGMASYPGMHETEEREMASEIDRKVITTQPSTVTGGPVVQTESTRITTAGPGPSELSRRIIVLVFGLIQLLIGARILLLLLDAREANPIVSAILNVSEVFVAPFEGILRTDALTSSGSILDVTAIVALVGWTILELVLIWVIGIFRHRSAGTTV